jgi:hypothetical protein
VAHTFARALPWAIGGDTAFLPNADAAMVAVDRRLRAANLSARETQELHALKRMLTSLNRDDGTLDPAVVAAAFGRFVTAWHKGNVSAQ